MLVAFYIEPIYPNAPVKSFTAYPLKICPNFFVFYSQPRSWLSFGQSFSSSPSVTGTGAAASAAGSGPNSPRTPGLSAFKSLSSPISSGSPGDVLGGVERDTDELFRSNTVQEIKQIEQQTRLDIDRRKEDLRQMVG